MSNIQSLSVVQHRASKRSRPAKYFFARLGQPISSVELHLTFGSSVRTRISELNRDPAGELVIRNHTYVSAAGEISTYTAWRHDVSTSATLTTPSPDRKVGEPPCNVSGSPSKSNTEESTGRLFPDDAPARHLDLG